MLFDEEKNIVNEIETIIKLMDIRVNEFEKV